MRYLIIAAGGGLGAVLRFAVSGFVQRLSDDAFPIGTLSVNVLGCLVIGFLGALFSGPAFIRDEWRFFLLTGLLGGFTTFSTFGYETLALIDDGEWARAGANVILSNGLGLVAVFIGYRLAGSLQGA
ncbi:MAG: fluoride efflux transporter CrcB [Candidatus Binatia bacterium]|nr:fluoride efflux transporter CrcB [Candidatus Binatia bacterium]